MGAGCQNWLWDPVGGEWHKAPFSVLTVRMVAIGQVIAGHHELYWMSLNPSAGNSAFELTDAIAALGAVVLDHFDSNRDGHILPFNPPMHFSTGIYLETLANTTSITFGYV